jgi:hypothetical protein
LGISFPSTHSMQLPRTIAHDSRIVNTATSSFLHYVY